MSMNRKPSLSPVIAACAIAAICVLGSCRLSPGNGAILYEGKSAAAVTALRSRIEPLRTELRGNTNFTEVTGRETLMFVGVKNGEFADCWIGYNRDEQAIDKDRQAILVAHTARTFRSSTQARHLRKLVDQTLGPDVLKLLTINFDEGLIDVR